MPYNAVRLKPAIQIQISLFLSQGWRWHSPSCFKVGEESLTFDDAKGMCNSNNATLVIINNRYWIQGSALVFFYAFKNVNFVSK